MWTGVVGGDAFDRDQPLRIHQHDLADGAARQIVRLDKRQFVGVNRKERADIAVAAARQHRHRRRIEQPRAQLRRHRVKVGVFVSQDEGK